MLPRADRRRRGGAHANTHVRIVLGACVMAGFYVPCSYGQGHGSHVHLGRRHTGGIRRRTGGMMCDTERPRTHAVTESDGVARRRP